MKHILAMILIASALFVSHIPVCLAQEMYVKDVTSLNLRAGKGVNYKIITTLDPGEPVTVLSTSGEWINVGTTEGNEGWVLSKYLTEEKPPDIKIENLKIQVETLKGKLEMAAIENQKLMEENINLATRLNENSIKLGNLEKTFNDLKENSTQYLTLKEKYDVLRKEVNEKNTKIRLLEEKVGDQYTAVAIKWSLTGAGILLIGYFLGYRSKRKRSSLL
ncbi:MAG: TIGR04211 family SH3 domain-containing protein [Spirochaetales bacterium]|jgi:SH3 domain protein|nr:TIGR04211 family SH3 domain-containing protein [Spirochaetales bacterium]